jgi:hypothetical protein
VGGGHPPERETTPWPQPSAQATLRHAIRRRPALHDIGDVDLFPLQPIAIEESKARQLAPAAIIVEKKTDVPRHNIAYEGALFCTFNRISSKGKRDIYIKEQSLPRALPNLPLAI